MTMKTLVVFCLVVAAVACAIFLVRHSPRARVDARASTDSDTNRALPDSPLQDPVRRGVRAFMRARYEEAFVLLEPAAEKGNLKAQQLLAKMYFAGHGVPADRAQYLYWMKRAADNGDKPSKAKVKKIESGRARTH